MACRIDGHTYRLHAPTPQLLDALAAGATLGVFPGCATDADHLWHRLYDPDDPLDLPHVEAAAAAVVQALAGWAAPGARLLATVAGEQWPLLAGRAAAAGTGDLLARPVYVVLGYAYSVLLDGCQNPDERDRLHGALHAPADPPGALLRQAVAQARRARRAAAVAAAAATPPPSGTPAPAGFTIDEQDASFRGVMAALAGLGGARG